MTFLLAAAGALVGSFVNWAIYNLCYSERGPVSPWNSPGDRASRRRWNDFIPVVGWLSLRRDEGVHGRLYWIRPMLIEIATAVGAVLFFDWQMDGGLIGGSSAGVAVAESVKLTWFSGHALLVTLMLIATFIDFDEKTIPDWITIPGTVTALLFAAFWPQFRLPEVVNNPGGIGAMMQHLHFASPGELPQWHHDGRGLGLALFVLGGWAFALIPTMPWLFRFVGKACRRRGLRGLCLVGAFMTQPKRKTACSLRTTPRKSLLPNLFGLGAIFLLLAALTAYLFFQPEPMRWSAYFSAVYGLAFGGGMVWAVRIVAGHAMGQEAMGFGDVTLMAMIGAFLGWQAALLTFVAAPFAALVIAVVQVCVTRRNDLAFGPYLCLAALMLILFWDPVWNERARDGLFRIGPPLFYILLGGLALLGAMLWVIQLYKSGRTA